MKATWIWNFSKTRRELPFLSARRTDLYTLTASVIACKTALIYEKGGNTYVEEALYSWSRNSKEDVLQAMATQRIDSESKEASALQRGISEKLKKVMFTENGQFLSTTSER